MKRTMFFAVAFWAISAGSAWPIDQIYTSTAPKPYYGKISGMTSTVINFEPQGKKGPNEIAANEVTRVILEDSPQGLLNAQEAIIKGNYEKAIEALEKETVEDKRAEVGQEITFCRASCATQLALGGGADPMEAGKQMFEFIKNNPTNFHYFKACELLGDIFVALGKFAEAQKYYTKLGEAPWPDYKIRAQVALGRSYLAQDNAAAASKAFDEAMNNAAPGELADVQRTAARIGKARCMVLDGKTDRALRDLNEVIDQMEEKNPEINAMAYNALGTALRKAGETKKAIRAFLHVHLIYFSQPDLDAEAVANLERLFTLNHEPKHASQMRSILNDRYANSRWTKGVR